MYKKASLLFAFLLVGVTSYAQTSLNTCSRSEETRVEACTNGKAAVWYYTITEENGNKRRSWLYRTQAEAERARDNEKKLCQTVARSFNKRDCQKIFGDIYCAGCGQKDSSDSNPELADLVDSGTRLLDQWIDTAQEFASDLLNGDGGGRGVGSVMAEYRDELQAAQTRVERLQDLLTRVSESNEPSLGRLTDAIHDVERAIKNVQAKHKSLSSGSAEQSNARGDFRISFYGGSVEIRRSGNRLTVANEMAAHPRGFAIEALIEGDRLTGIIRNAKIGASEVIESARIELELKPSQWGSKLYVGRIILSDGSIREGVELTIN